MGLWRSLRGNGKLVATSLSLCAGFGGGLAAAMFEQQTYCTAIVTMFEAIPPKLSITPIRSPEGACDGTSTLT